MRKQSDLHPQIQPFKPLPLPSALRILKPVLKHSLVLTQPRNSLANTLATMTPLWLQPLETLVSQD